MFARPALRMAAAALLATLFLARADDASTNAPPATSPGSTNSPSATLPQTWTFHPIILTNIAPQPFLESRPEAAPTPGERPALSLQNNGSTNAPDVVAPNSDSFSNAYESTSSMNWGNDLASHLLVVYNTADADSKALAQYYASVRNIPAERVLGITLSLIHI